MFANMLEKPGLTFEDWGPVVVKHGATVHMWTANFGRKEFPSWRGVKRLECQRRRRERRIKKTATAKR